MESQRPDMTTVKQWDSAHKCPQCGHVMKLADIDLKRPRRESWSVRIATGRHLHHEFRGLLSVHSRYGLHACRVTFTTLFHRRLQQLCYLHRCSDCYRTERTSSRVGLAPTVD